MKSGGYKIGFWAACPTIIRLLPFDDCVNPDKKESQFASELLLCWFIGESYES